MEKIYLDVEFSQKDIARNLKCRGDKEAKKGGCDPSNLIAIETFRISTINNESSKNKEPNFKKGEPGQEDRSFGDKNLFIDLVPSTTGYNNARSKYSKEDWQKISEFVRNRANNKCEVCASSKIPQAHERWDFDDKSKKQVMRRLICLCDDCHRTTHSGLANIQGKLYSALGHLQKITKMNDSEVRKHYSNAGDLGEKRSTIVGEIDTSMVETLPGKNQK